MTYYLIIESDIISPQWIPDYLTHVPTILEGFGGCYVSKTAKIELIEGDSAPQFSLIATFPSKQAFYDFYACEEYRPYKEMRLNGAKSRILLTPAS